MTRSKHNIMRIFRFFLPLFLMGQMSAVALSAPKKAAAKPVYDHLVQPDYRTPYGIPAEASVTASLEKILAYLEANTPMAVLDGRTGKPLSDIGQIDSLSRLQQGKFRLSCYEWGVTYAAMLKAGAVTGNRRFTDYTLDRLGFLAATASAFQPFVGQGILRRDGQMRQVMNPKALDDCGAMCAAMIQASSEMAPGTLDACILNYMEWIMDKQYRLPDGHLARIRPYRNSVWLDDMFMSSRPSPGWAPSPASKNISTKPAANTVCSPKKCSSPKRGCSATVGWSRCRITPPFTGGAPTAGPS